MTSPLLNIIVGLVALAGVNESEAGSARQTFSSSMLAMCVWDALVADRKGGD